MYHSIANKNNVVYHLQHYTVFRGLSYILYGALWLYYLQQLLHHKHENKRCQDVQPILRNVLLVIAWLKIVFIVIFLCIMITSLLLKPSLDVFVFVIACVIIACVFVYQIQFIYSIEDTDLYTKQCRDIEEYKRNVIYVFTVVVFVFGLFLIAFGLSGESVLRKLMNTDTKKT